MPCAHPHGLRRAVSAWSIGPMLVTGRLGDAWIYLVGPLVGSALAVALTWAVHGPAPTDEDQVEAAEGEASGR